MRPLIAGAALFGVGLALWSPAERDQYALDAPAIHGSAAVEVDGVRPSANELSDVVEQYCVRCHNERRMTGNLALEGFDVAAADERADVAERMIVKLRAGMMPPPGNRRPAPTRFSPSSRRWSRWWTRRPPRTRTRARDASSA